MSEALALSAACFVSGLIVGVLSRPAPQLDPDQWERIVRRHIALQIRQYAELARPPKLANVIRIVEGKKQ